jgi:hypothetical protein
MCTVLKSARRTAVKKKGTEDEEKHEKIKTAKDDAAAEYMRIPRKDVQSCPEETTPK